MISTLFVTVIEHRMIRAAMAELQLVRLAAKREPQDLMPQADPEDGTFPISFCTCASLQLERLRIAGTVGKKHAVGLERQRHLRRK